MFAEVITIGDELLIGQVVDTNSAWMGQELNKIGIEVLRIVSIRDREEEIMEAVDNAMKRVNIVLVTGGLGPTKDDITKQTLCKYFHTELIFSEEVFENVKRVLAGKIPMNALNKSQAMVPKDCTVINNPVGSASVSWFEKDNKVLVSMPGVPQEMTAVMTESVLPKLREKFQTDVIMHRTFLVQHYPESILAEKLEPWETALPESIKLAYLPKLGIIRLRLTGRGQNKIEVESALNDEQAKLEAILGDDIFSEEDIPLEEIVGEIQDEFDEERPEVEEKGSKTYSVDGKMLLEDVNDTFELALDTENCDTIGGWVYSQLDYPPKVGQKVQTPAAAFTVEEIDKMRIVRVGIQLLHEPEKIHEELQEEHLEDVK